MFASRTQRPLLSRLQRVGTVLGTAALLSLSGLAHAEDADDWSLGYGGGFDGMMDVYRGPSLELASTQLDRIANVLQLDDVQREEMMGLFKGLEDQHLTAWVRYAERNGDMQNKMMTGKDNWQEVQKDQRENAEEYQAEQDRLIDLMLDDLRLLVTAEQDARWGNIERERRRMDTLTRYGCYPAERFDLIEVIGTLNLEDQDRAKFAPMLEEYAAQMDALLVSRNRALEKAADANAAYNEAQRAMWTMDWDDPETAMKSVETQENINKKQREAVELALAARPACKRVADLNTQFADQAKEMLSDRDRREFEKMTAESAEGDKEFWDPENYSRCRQKFQMALNMEQMIGAYETFASSMSSDEWGIMRIAREMEPLTATQITQLESLQDEFEAEMELLEMRKPGPKIEPEDKMKWAFTLRTPEGNMSLTHNDPPEGVGGGNNKFMISGGASMVAFGGGEEGSEAMQEYMDDRAKLEQKYIEAMREFLTLRQRALIALR